MLMAAFVIAGCGSQEGGDGHGEATHAEASHGEATQDTHAAEPAKAMDWSEAEMAILVHADEADGATDHVIAKCASCMLHMDGKAEFAMQAGDYEMHFCSEKCKESFAEDMHASLQKLSMPEEGGEEEAHQH
jgi:hypothetical protein